MTAKKKTIPSFRTDEEERKFWTKHGVEEFSDQLEDLEVEIKPARSGQIAVRLYSEDLEALQHLAKEKGVGHTTLARSVLEHWIARSRGKAPDPRRKKPNKALHPTNPVRARASRG
jgi:predicted DNA binding CopG/RHH family protein